MIVFQDYYHDDLLFEELVRMFEKANQEDMVYYLPEYQRELCVVN